MTILRCHICNARLTTVLNVLTEVREYDSVQDEDFFAKGEFYKNHEMEEGFYLLNIFDCVGLKDHSDKNRFVGCCGPSPSGELNKICINCKAEIGRETTDCLTPHYTKIAVDKVKIEDDEFGFFKLLCHPFSIQIGIGRLADIELLYQYSNKSKAFGLLANELINLKENLPPEINSALRSVPQGTWKHQ